MTSRSTGSDRGHEQSATIVVWAREGSARSALLAAERIASLVDGAPLALAGHRLVSLRIADMDVRREGGTNLAHVTLHLRAVTEVISCPPPLSAGMLHASKRTRHARPKRQGPAH